LFPLQNYDQTISAWIKPTDADYDKPLLTKAAQNTRATEWYNHYFGLQSPWNPAYLQELFVYLTAQDLKKLELEKINNLTIKTKQLMKSITEKIFVLIQVHC